MHWWSGGAFICSTLKESVSWYWIWRVFWKRIQWIPFFLFMEFIEDLSKTVSLPSQSRGKICVRTTNL